ncbi:FHA domain-containing protein [Leifsonia poae]|uniref:FHA domain-containing protein n=1 Tax=Leifsonia poae TaxID=110933 RepID=UPI003D6848E5
MDDSGFIVPPPGLIPSRPDPAPSPDAPRIPDRRPGPPPPADREPAPGRPLPAFTPPPGPGGPVVPARPVWRLHLPGDRSLPVTRPVLLGRNPSAAAAPAGAVDAELIALDDPASTVSKTHAALLPDGDALTVIDLHSTNGVTLAGVRIPAGEPVPVTPGSELLLGDLRVRAERS